MAKVATVSASTRPKPSPAEVALCALVAFRVGPDLPRLDALFRASGLCRAKWERADPSQSDHGAHGILRLRVAGETAGW